MNNFSELDKFFLTREQVAHRLKGFGFIEVSDICRFLDFIAGAKLDRSDCLYVREKLRKILNMYDDKSKYFIPLRELTCELDLIVRSNFILEK